MNSDENRLVRTIYDYESTDDKILSFKSGDIFVVLKLGGDYLYTVNAYGRLGYIPTSFSEPTNLNDNEYLQFVKNVLSLLESSLTKNPNITKRQINHAQVKLTQLRCELVKKLAKLTPITPESNKKSFVLDCIEAETRQSNEDLSCSKLDSRLNSKSRAEEQANLANESSSLKSDPHSLVVDSSASAERQPTIQCNDAQFDIVSKAETDQQPPSTPTASSVPDCLALELLEKVRLSTNLNYNVCKLTLKSVLDCLKLRLPSWHDDCNAILRQLSSSDQAISKEFILASTDYLELKSLFSKLWHCHVNDDQQRSWPIQEDEEQIKYILSSLANILTNANSKISKEVLCENDCENISLLIQYFQMENRAPLKLELYLVLLQAIRLLPNIIPEIMLPSVLPCALCNELINYKMDNKRWTLASKLFTAIFSTGHKPPISIYDYINEQFINSLLDLVEEPNPTNEIEISPEYTIPPILAFNLHFNAEDDDYNYVINSLRNRNSASHLLENLVSYLNWDYPDPTRLTSILANEINDGNQLCYDLDQLEQMENQLNQTYKMSGTSDNKADNQSTDQSTGQSTRKNAVHKLLLEVFDDEIIANLFYYNDLSVLVDVIVTHLNNLHSEDKNRIFYLELFLRVCQNTNYKDQPHKLKEILKCLKMVLNDEQSTDQEKRLAEIIIELFV